MGLFLTLVYILISFLGSATIFGPIAGFHVQIVIAALALLFSIPALQNSNLLRMPQTLAIAGLCLAVSVSMVASGWIGGAPVALLSFVPNVLTYFLIVLNCKTKRRLQLVVLVLLFGSCFYIIHGYLALRASDLTSPYLLDQGAGEGIRVLRIRGLAMLNDPNDLSQVLVSLIPCMFLFWQRGRLAQSSVLVVPLIAILLFGMYLTHSRGAMVALVAITAVSARRKIGALPALVFAAVVFAAASALHWSGGRDVSVEAGADRMDAWARGLELIRAHPIFGVGFMRFTDYYEITAHNSIVVCAAEIGMVGFFFWVLFSLTAIRDCLMLGNADRHKHEIKEVDRAVYAPMAVIEGPASVPVHAYLAMQRAEIQPGITEQHERNSAGEARHYLMGPDMEDADPTASEVEIRRMAGLMMIALTGYLTAGWFLSRPYQMWLYIYGGMAQAVFQMAVHRGFAPSRGPLMSLLRLTVYTSVGLIALVYVILRLENLMHR